MPVESHDLVIGIQDRVSPFVRRGRMVAMPNFKTWLANRVRYVDAGYVSPCWAWQGDINDQGYGRIVASRWTGHFRKVRAHRFVWEQMKGPIPEGLQLDHLCRNRACVNPEHLDPVTGKINTVRAVLARCEPGKYCCGHDRSEANTVAKGKVVCCRTCHNARQRAYNSRKRDNILRGKFARLKVAG